MAVATQEKINLTKQMEKVTGKPRSERIKTFISESLVVLEQELLTAEFEIKWGPILVEESKEEMAKYEKQRGENGKKLEELRSRPKPEKRDEREALKTEIKDVEAINQDLSRKILICEENINKCLSAISSHKGKVEYYKQRIALLLQFQPANLD